MLLRANVLLRPTSGVRPELVEALLAMLNAGVIPLVPEQGSVGASGDLAPLSHIALALMGEGEVLGGARSGPGRARPWRRPELAPFRFAPKEGLAFINGTQAQTALLALLVHDAEVLWRTAVGAAAMSLEALRGTPAPLDPRIHEARPHRGQRGGGGPDAAAAGRQRDPGVAPGERPPGAGRLLAALRAAGAGRGGRRDPLRRGRPWRSSSTPRPTIRWSSTSGEVISGGNFHGQPVAQALDFLATALTTLQAIAERRVERLVNPDLSQGLPAFLTADPGLSSGFMMVQISAASLVAESRTLAMPASIGSIPTDANQEDFVPMGMAAAWKALRILANAQRVVAAELLCAAQGLEFLEPLRPGRRRRGAVPPTSGAVPRGAAARRGPAAGARSGAAGAGRGVRGARSRGGERVGRLGFLPPPYPHRYLSTAKPLMP